MVGGSGEEITPETSTPALNCKETEFGCCLDDKTAGKVDLPLILNSDEIDLFLFLVQHLDRNMLDVTLHAFKPSLVAATITRRLPMDL